MNWGKGIIGGMVIFMLFIICMCIYMFNVPADDFDHQYYEKGLNFNQEYNREQQVTKDNARPTITQANGALQFVFSKPVVGEVKFMRPSSTSMDKVFQLNSDTGRLVTIPLANMARGPWQLSIEWKSNNKQYLYKKEVLVK